MSTKLSNEHITRISQECKEYKILDIYIILAHISSEVKSGKYLIQTYSSKRSDLINIVHKYCPNAAYKTVSNCINKLEKMNIIVYEEALCAWSLKNMEKMTKSKDEAETEEERESLSGYTNIRKFFLTDEFFNMKAREKRIVIYICQLLDSKASKNYRNISINLLKFNNSWLKILKTKCKYYAKNTIEHMLNKYKDIFNDFSDKVRENDIAPKTVTNFKFAFTCESLNNKNSEEDMLELIKMKNPKEYALVKERADFAHITLSKQKVMHLVRAISTLKEWFLKERVVQLVVNKYIAIQIHHSRENIKSLPAYAAAVVKAVVNEYNSFKETCNNKLSFNIINNYYDHYIDTDISDTSVSEDIQYALSMMKAV
ncbi:hypothetical protein [uncultured Clostridium sp.]|uniref:hypothetical protein n=1 Tax=uncultured Clostridium sp. TaxID=59620 RepID=UPI0025DB1CA0|nr:hypothetical protein [uncultured Clostridium sp.]